MCWFAMNRIDGRWGLKTAQPAKINASATPSAASNLHAESLSHALAEKGSDDLDTHAGERGCDDDDVSGKDTGRSNYGPTALAVGTCQ
jgi:hypothetical protein